MSINRIGVGYPAWYETGKSKKHNNSGTGFADSLAFAGISNVKPAYEKYESGNYRIVPDNENGCFDIYNKQGEKLGVFNYSDIKIGQDSVTGKQVEKLAETYFNKYPNLIESKEEACIWADFEIRGLARHTDNGIISMGYDGMSYNDNSNDKNNWSIRFAEDTYKLLFEWLQSNRGSIEEMQIQMFCRKNLL